MINGISNAATGLATQKLLTDVSLSVTKKAMDSQSNLLETMVQSIKDVPPAPKSGVGSRMNLLA